MRSAREHPPNPPRTTAVARPRLPAGPQPASPAAAGITTPGSASALPSTLPASAPSTRQPKPLDRLREALRSRHYSPRTEQAYRHWRHSFATHLLEDGYDIRTICVGIVGQSLVKRLDVYA